MTEDDIMSLMTPELVVAFRRGDTAEVDRLLGLKPWEVSPLDATGPCPYPHNSAAALSWPTAVRLRRAIVKVLKEGMILDDE